jgi:hypothetical protein
VLIFCSGPYTAETFEGFEDNLYRADEASKEVLIAGHVPICPHKITAFFDLDPEFQEWQHEDWLTKFCYPLIDACDAVYFYEGWQNSKGAQCELQYAKAKGKKLLFSVKGIT